MRAVENERADPLRAFEHDHAELTVLALGVRDLLQRIRREPAPEELFAELGAKLEELREDLLLHFAREEEGLFPFVAAQLPDLAGAVSRLRAAHDEICGAVLRVSYAGRDVRQGSPGGGKAALASGLPALLDRFERFEQVYTEHARAERELLQQLSVRLDERHRAELVKLIEGL